VARINATPTGVAGPRFDFVRYHVCFLRFFAPVCEPAVDFSTPPIADGVTSVQPGDNGREQLQL
jgi:hypothetical protein